jgi:hypothetical protein
LAKGKPSIAGLQQTVMWLCREYGRDRFRILSSRKNLDATMRRCIDVPGLDGKMSGLIFIFRIIPV